MSSPISEEKLTQQIAEHMMAGGTLGSVYDYTEQDYEAVYALGHNLYSQGRYDDAVKAFGFLVIHNAWERKYLKAFGAALQMVEQYQEAIKYYTMAAVLDLSDPVPTFHTAECMIPLGMLEEAKQSLDLVVAQCKTPEQEPLKQRAQAMLALMNQSAAKA
jgi:type III secretion system low calcium response chaperone LcrH/SycD